MALRYWTVSGGAGTTTICASTKTEAKKAYRDETGRNANFAEKA